MTEGPNTTATIPDLTMSHYAAAIQDAADVFNASVRAASADGYVVSWGMSYGSRLPAMIGDCTVSPEPEWKKL